MNGLQFVRLCACGCGQPTRVTKRTKGQPSEFVHRHARRKHAPDCSVPGCDGRQFATGYCQKHYSRTLRHGTLLGHRPREDAITRFWMRVDKAGPNSCWVWTASRGDHGYGTLQGDDGRTVGAHRFSYELHHGPIPAGLLVMHSCDNPPCVNPGHLSAGTHADNMRDMAAKGRQWRQRKAS